MPIACDKCRENLALLIEPKASTSDAQDFARAAEAADSEPARAATPALSAAERAELEAHIAECPECAHELALLRAMIGELQTLPIAAAPAALRSRIRAEIAGESKLVARVKEPASPPAWLTTWRNFFRSPARVAWASGVAMAAFAMFMMRDQPLSTLPSATNPDNYSKRQPLVTTAPQDRTPPTDKPKPGISINGKAANTPNTAAGRTKAATPATAPRPGAAALPGVASDAAPEPSETSAPEIRRPQAAAPMIRGGRSAPAQPKASGASAAAAQSGLAAASGPAMMAATPSPRPGPSAALKSPPQDERFSRITVLPQHPEPSPGAEFHAFSLPVNPEAGDSIPSAAKSAPEGTTERRPFRMRGGGEVDSMVPPNAVVPGAVPTAPVSPPAALEPRPGRERVTARGIGNVAEIEKASPAKNTLPGEIAPDNNGTQDMTASAQNYSAQNVESESANAKQATRPTNPVTAFGSAPALLAAPTAPSSVHAKGGGVANKPNANLKRNDLAAAGRAGNALPVGRSAEIEVKLTPAQNAAQAEARVVLPLGLRFTTRSFEKSQTVWSGPVSQKKPLDIRFKVTGAQSGLWPVDITLQKPDGTKLDSMTVKVIVVP